MLFLSFLFGAVASGVCAVSVSHSVGLPGVTISGLAGVTASTNTLTLNADTSVGSVDFHTFTISDGETLTCNLATGYTLTEYPLMMLRSGSAGMVIDGQLNIADGLHVALHTPFVSFGTNGRLVADAGSKVGVFLQDPTTPLVDMIVHNLMRNWAESEMISLDEAPADARLSWDGRNDSDSPVLSTTHVTGAADVRYYTGLLPSTLNEVQAAGGALTVIVPADGGAFATVAGLGWRDALAAGYEGATVTQFYFVEHNGSLRLYSDDGDGGSAVGGQGDYSAYSGGVEELYLEDLANSSLVQSLPNGVGVGGVRKGILAADGSDGVNLPSQELAEATWGQEIDLEAESANFLADQADQGINLAFAPPASFGAPTQESVGRSVDHEDAVEFVDDASGDERDVFDRGFGGQEGQEFDPSQGPEGVGGPDAEEAALDQGGPEGAVQDGEQDFAKEGGDGTTDLDGALNIAGPGEDPRYVTAKGVTEVVQALGSEFVADALGDSYEGGRDAFIQDLNNGELDVATVARKLTVADVARAVSAVGVTNFVESNPELVGANAQEFINDFQNQSGIFDASNANKLVF